MDVIFPERLNHIPDTFLSSRSKLIIVGGSAGWSQTSTSWKAFSRGQFLASYQVVIRNGSGNRLSAVSPLPGFLTVTAVGASSVGLKHGGRV